MAHFKLITYSFPVTQFAVGNIIEGEPMTRYISSVNRGLGYALDKSRLQWRF